MNKLIILFLSFQTYISAQTVLPFWVQGNNAPVATIDSLTGSNPDSLLQVYATGTDIDGDSTYLLYRFGYSTDSLGVITWLTSWSTSDTITIPDAMTGKFPVVGTLPKSLTGGRTGREVYAWGDKIEQAIPVTQTNLVFYWDGKISLTDSTLYNKATQAYDTNVKLLSWTGTTNDSYVSAKSTTQLVFYGDTVPITCLFQNYNYADTLYFKMAEHTINADSTEALPYRLDAIAYYSSGQTGSDSVSTWTWAGVPNIAQDGVQWLDTTSTFTAATALATAGDTILVKGGYYNEATYLLANKSVTYIGVGDVTLTSQDATYNVRISANNVKFQNIELRVADADAAVHSVTPNNMYFERCYMTGSSYGINALSSTGTIDIDKCVLDLTTGVTGYGIYCRNNTSERINESYVKSRITYGKVGGTAQQATNLTVAYSDIDAEWNVVAGRDDYASVGTDSTVYDIRYSDLSAITINVDVTDNTGRVTLLGNNIYAIDDNPIFVVDSSNYDSIYISHNNFYHATDTGYLGLYFKDQHYVDIQNNTFNVTRWGGATDIDIQNKWLDSVNFKFNYNRVDHRSLTVNLLAVGDVDNTEGNETIKGEVVGNWVRDVGYYYPAIGGKSHGMVVYYQSDVDFLYNRVEGSGLAIVHKSQGLDCSNSLVAYNVLKNCNVGLESKGSTNITYANNTIFNNSSVTGYGFNIIRNSTDSYEPADSCYLYNNIVYDIGGNADYELIHWETEQDTLFSDYNILYTENGKVHGTYTTFEQWQTWGQDANSYNLNPNFTSATQLCPVSEFEGTNLGTDYDDGLDITTDWTTTPPTIVLKQQDAAWQIGTYVK